MNSLAVSNPVLSPPFLAHKLSSGSGTSKRLIPNGLFVSPRTFKAKCTMDTTYGGGNVSKFSRSNVWDPYKRLGISTDASEEEVWSSRNFLLDQYSGHERSVESIEAAFEKILMTSFLKRKKSKINLKSRLKKQVEESPPWVQNLISFIELPPNVIIVRRLFLFAFMACWSVNSSAEGGPAFQCSNIESLVGESRATASCSAFWRKPCLKYDMSRKWLRPKPLSTEHVALSLMACMYFLYDKTKSLARASIIGLGSLVVGWICGSCLVPMIPSALLQPTWTLELLTTLVAYIFLFAGCTFLK